MELTITSFLIVCPLVFLASFVDAVAGGGGLIALPAYILGGAPVHGAIATNKLSSSVGTVISTAKLYKYADLKLAVPTVILALIGSWCGAYAVLMVDDKYLKYLMFVILPVTAFFILRKKMFDNEGAEIPRKRLFIIASVASFVIGFYDGFYGPGTGTFLLIVFTGLAKMNLLTASANMKLVNLASNLAALVAFIVNGKVLFALGLAASVFSIAGHYIGAEMAVKNGAKIVKPVILIVLALLFVKLIFDY